MEESLQKIKKCLESLVVDEIVKNYMFADLSSFKEKCKNLPKFKKQKSNPRDETCLERLIRDKLKQELKIERKKPISYDLFERKRKLDIEIKEQNNSIVLEIKLNYSLENPKKKSGYKTWGWDEAFIQTILDAYKYPERHRVIIIFDRFINRNLTEEEKLFLEELKDKSKIYYFRFFTEES